MGLQAGERKRKVRSDKKKDIKPIVNLELKDSIYRLAYIVKTPVKDVCVDLIENALFGNEKVLLELSKYFRRSIKIKNTIFRGDLKNEKLYSVAFGEKGRVSFRVNQEEYEFISALSYVFDCSVSAVSAVLLYESITDGVFIEKYVETYLNTIDKSEKKELKALLKYIRTETGESYSLVDLLSYLVDEPIRWTFPS